MRSFPGFVAPLALSVITALTACAAPSEDVGRSEGEVTTTIGSAEQILSVDFFHHVDIEVDGADIEALDRNFDDPDEARRSRVKVPCAVTIDGQRYDGAKISKKGFFGSASDLNGKPAFNISFGDTRPAGLKKITLNNALQDGSYLHEHMAYELYRRAGLHAPLTTHGGMTFNGRDYGLYVIVEPVDKTALKKWYGDNDGNLYEANAHDFVHGIDNGLFFELKDEEEEGRNREDLRRLVSAMGGKDATGPIDVDAVGQSLDLENYLLAYALDSAMAHSDGPFWNDNNYYFYNNPADGRFVLIPHGADQVFENSRDLFTPPKGRLPRRIRETPALEDDLHAKVDYVIDQVWDEGALVARMEHARDVINSSGATGGALANDVNVFNNTFEGMRAQILGRKAR